MLNGELGLWIIIVVDCNGVGMTNKFLYYARILSRENDGVVVEVFLETKSWMHNGSFQIDKLC